MDNIRPIRTEADYEWALAEVAPYFDREPEPGSPESDRFLVLVDLISAYEEKHYPMPDPDPIDMIRHVMEQKGYAQKDFADLLGSKSRASEILKRKRPLTMNQAYKLNREWGVPAEALIRPYHTGDAA
ncbi:helix-turn-helix domain-containing protein [Labrys wisconsinensis]|uniref:HTH-type transcriptional regulator/antitoxin HigA n=1 Tax=Labrys wisconsinensis TaxID=425677 RepID=A0ABU0J090_9HYPH|nr:XRE family transcriptional regulator [Labrys wisconsinensis]MDQ0467676.1 HTH-type transcriptional regulator/antitoxin HigA [Labrys wisconsinensis]